MTAKKLIETLESMVNEHGNADVVVRDADHSVAGYVDWIYKN